MQYVYDIRHLAVDCMSTDCVNAIFLS